MILVTGANGHLGGATIAGLLEKVPASSLRGLVRKAEKGAGLKAQGVDVAAGDSLKAYMASVEALFKRSLAKLRAADTSGGTGVNEFAAPMDCVT